MTFFTPNGTTDFARHPDETAHSNLCEKNLSIHLGTDQQMSAHLFCSQQWKLLRQYGSVFVPKREMHACLPAHSLPWPVIQLVSDNLAKTIPIQHTTIRSALVLFVPACPVIGLTQTWFVVVIHGMIVKNTTFLDVNSGWKSVGVKGVCLADSVGKSTF